MSTKADYNFYKSIGICVRCHKNPAKPNRVMCDECLEKSRKTASENRKVLKTMGICPRCGKNKLFGNEKMCIECSAKMYEYNISHRTGQKINYIQKRKAAGICTKCGKKKPVSGKTKCAICAHSERIRAREYRSRKGIDVDRSERAGNGRCYFCGTFIGTGRVCTVCRERITESLPKNSGNEQWRQDNQRIFAGKCGIQKNIGKKG